VRLAEQAQHVIVTTRQGKSMHEYQPLTKFQAMLEQALTPEEIAHYQRLLDDL
jgi:hypothetical protein